MLMFVVLAVSLISVNGALLPPVPMLDGRIVGGDPAHISEAPYQVALLIGDKQVCGGSIVSRSVILTTAHCIERTSPTVWSVRAGATFYHSGGQIVGVSRLIIHDNYNTRRDHDIALMHLSTFLKLEHWVAIIPLPLQGASVPDDSSAFVTGWGAHSEGGSSPTQLYKLTIPTVNQKICQSAYADFNPVTNNMICAGNMTSGGQDVCQGDYGGPMNIGGILHGVASWGFGCARPGYPGVWTRVANYRSWINSNS